MVRAGLSSDRTSSFQSFPYVIVLCHFGVIVYVSAAKVARDSFILQTKPLMPCNKCFSVINIHLGRDTIIYNILPTCLVTFVQKTAYQEGRQASCELSKPQGARRDVGGSFCSEALKESIASTNRPSTGKIPCDNDAIPCDNDACPIYYGFITLLSCVIHYHSICPVRPRIRVLMQDDDDGPTMAISECQIIYH